MFRTRSTTSIGSSDDDDRKMPVATAGSGQFLEHAVTVEPGHVKVEQDHVRVGHPRQVETR
jgi:hypothetical protein